MHKVLRGHACVRCFERLSRCNDNQLLIERSNSPRRRSLGLAELYAKAISAQCIVLLAAITSPPFPMVIFDTLWSYCQIPRLSSPGTARYSAIFCHAVIECI